MKDDTPHVYTDATRPWCRTGYVENQGLIHLAIFGWLQAQESGRTVPAEQEKLVRDCLAAVVVGRRDPREVFGWDPEPTDKRRTRKIWREQLMAAEVLRLVHEGIDETRATEYVADAFETSITTVRNALKEWRSDLISGGDLARYLFMRYQQTLT